jgi:S-formylglutathione hydrolase
MVANDADGLKLLVENRCFGGSHRRYSHHSEAVACEMTFAVFLPPQALAGEPVPALYWLSGLTCTDENVMQKSGIQRLAAILGLAIVAPDTSPRGKAVPGDPEGSWDFGHGAGFYVDATREPWSRHYRMHSYVVHELPVVLQRELPLSQRRGLCGHSMGGHGALVCALRNPSLYGSVSAFAPICHPIASPWGQKAFHHFFGEESESWRQWDAVSLLQNRRLEGMDPFPILVDQGGADPYLEQQLKPRLLAEAADATGYPLSLRVHEGYDHSYFFIATFIDDHVRHHAHALGCQTPAT